VESKKRDIATDNHSSGLPFCNNLTHRSGAVAQSITLIG
jgi:hypothetical protein